MVSSILFGLVLSAAPARAVDGSGPVLGVGAGPLVLLGTDGVLQPAGSVRLDGGLRIGEGPLRVGVALDLSLQNGQHWESPLQERGAVLDPGDLFMIRLAPQVGLGTSGEHAAVQGRVELGLQRWASPISEEYLASDLGLEADAGAGAGLWAGVGFDAGLVTSAEGMSVGLSLDLNYFVGDPIGGLALYPRLSVALPL